MRTRIGALLTAATILGGLTIGTPMASAQTVVSQPFSAYATGTATSINALNLLVSQLANAQITHSAAVANSQGLSGSLTNEMGQNVQPPQSGKNAYGRGSGLEVGLVVPAEQQRDVNQVILSGIAEANAPPSTTDTATIPIAVPGLLAANVLRGDAAATFNANICVVGKPLSAGRGRTTDLQVLPNAPLVGTVLGQSGVTESQSLTYLIPNGDGTFGVVSETRQLLAPINVLNGAVTIRIDGEIILRAIATGKPNGARIEFPGNPLVTIGTPLDPDLLQVNLSDIVSPTGLPVDLSPVARLIIGEDPRAIDGDSGSAPVIATNGTAASAALDTILLQLLSLEPLIEVADIRLGHMEVAAAVPEGGLKCNIPVAKVGAPDPVPVGQDFTITIRIPSDAALFNELYGCDLINIQAVDVHSVESGNARFVLTGASNGGQISADGTTVTFTNLGNYRRDDPPITLTVTGRIPSDSGAGRLMDIVTVSATLGNCTGSGLGDDIVGSVIGSLTNTGAVGSFVLSGPEVAGGVLAATGGTQSWPLLGGGALLLGAFALRRRLRKPADTTS